jgi:hypothetical protein
MLSGRLFADGCWVDAEDGMCVVETPSPLSRPRLEPLPSLYRRRSILFILIRGMRNTPQLAAHGLGGALFDTARLAARSLIRSGRLVNRRWVKTAPAPAATAALSGMHYPAV